MERHRNKHFQNCDPPLNSLNSSKTLSESFHNSSHETLGSFDFDDNSSPVSESTALDNNGNSDYDSFLEEPDLEEETVLTDISPVNRRSYSHWAEPWSGMKVQKPAADTLSLAAPEEHKLSSPDWTDMPPSEELLIRPSVSPLLTDYKRHHVGAGLENLGNTCYLNSVLQCFTHSVPLLNGIISFNHKCTCDDFFEGFCVLCALRQHIEFSLVCFGGVVRPLKFADNLSYFSSSFQKYEQEDAHEFLQCFLDKLENCCNDLMQKDVTNLGNNIVKKVFGGRLVSSLRCCNCGHCSNTYEPSIDLSLEIDNADTLYTALNSFTKIEKIEDPETKFTCEECKEQVSVQKQLMLDQAPSVATFHLKRFKNDGSVVEKIDKYVAFPVELDMHPYTTGDQHNNVDLKYYLYAVLVHIGLSSCSGHYYCFIRSSGDSWFKCDDSKVMRVPEEYVLSQEAYILFYAKQETPFFSNFLETLNQCIDPAIQNTSPKSVLDNVDPSVSSSSVPLNGCGDVNETASDSTEEVFLETSSEPKNSKADSCDDKENKVPATVALTADSTACEPPREAVDKSSESILKVKNSNEGFVEVKVVADETLKTPSRSPSPEIYGDDPPESTFSIPRGHLKSTEHLSCKKQLKDLESFEIKQACTLIKKNMPGSRGQQFIQAVVRSTRREGSQNKKRNRPRHSSPTMEDRKSHTRSRGNIPLVAGRLRANDVSGAELNEKGRRKQIT